jgi:hypothetical protein
MTKSHAAAVTQLREAHVLLRAQAREIASLRLSTRLQSERIAELQAELAVRRGARAPQSAVLDPVPPGSVAETGVLESELNHVWGMSATSPADEWFRRPTAWERTRPPSTSSLRVWHRNHADRVVAEVAPIGGIGNWRTCAAREIGQERDAYEGPSFPLLVAAQAAADALAQSRFGHACDGRCGQWHPAERRRSGFEVRHGSTARVSMAADHSPSGASRLELRRRS